jgi:hypothetical protein
MAQQQQGGRLSAEEIRRLAQEWLDKGGREQLTAALKAAEEANQTLWKEVRIDPAVMNKPVTV